MDTDALEQLLLALDLDALTDEDVARELGRVVDDVGPWLAAVRARIERRIADER